MSSNSGVIVNRSNETSPFFQALASRNSKSLPELYSAEINTESAAQSLVEIESSSNPGYSRTVRIELPRYGLLNKLYLHATFSADAGTTTTACYTQQIPFLGAMCIKEARVVYNGATIQKTDGFSIVSEMWKNYSDKEKKHLQELLGAFDPPQGTQTAANIVASKTSDNTSRRARGVQDFYCPLDLYFSSRHSPNRALDLSVLSSPVILEIDIESESNLFHVQSALSDYKAPTLTNVSAMCYLTELDSEVEKNYRALSYAAGGSPLTQIAFNTERIQVASGITMGGTGDGAKVVDVKLNQFTGNIFKLLVFAVTSDNFATNDHRFRPLAIDEIQLKATGTNIVNQDNLMNKESILESYHCGGNYHPIGIEKGSAAVGTNVIAITNHGDSVNVLATDNVGGLGSGFTAAAAAYINESVRSSAGTEWHHNITCNPNNIFEINFKKPYDMSKVSNSGSVALGQLSVPSLRVAVSNAGAASVNRQFGADSQVLAAAGTFDIHVVAYSTSLISYNTNSSGSTSLRMIQN
jgi:hypothetical protein